MQPQPTNTSEATATATVAARTFSISYRFRLQLVVCDGFCCFLLIIGVCVDLFFKILMKENKSK